MAEQTPKQTPSPSDEIDLGQLFQMIRNSFKKLFRSFLGIYVYLRRNIYILIGLIVLGLAVGYGLKQIVAEKLKIEVIVRPNLESKNYLYDVVNELEANIKAQDSIFFEGIGVHIDNFKGLEVTIETVGDKILNDQDMEYLELLEKFQSSGFVSDVVRAEILNRTSLNHRITFYYKDGTNGPETATKVMEYINSNDYFNDLTSIYMENAKERIEKDHLLVDQIDNLVAKYSETMGRGGTGSGEGKIVLDNEEKMDITGLLDLKNNLIRDIERKKLDLREQNEAITIVNFGKPQQVQKAFFGKKLVLLPAILVCLFFIFSFIKFLNKKALEMNL
ncbi:MAG: hypothetical protein MUO53_10340 [Maribacter sp.]|nr:hypothetical protein [Maribacter sp.]